MNGESATAGTFFVLSRFVLRWPGEEYVGTEGHSSIRVLYAALRALDADLINSYGGLMN